MPQYSQQTRERLLSLPVESVLSHYGRRTDRPCGRGHYFSPFRDESTPSFEVRGSVWTDWGSGRKGGLIDLVCLLEGCSRTRAMDVLASIGSCPSLCVATAQSRSPRITVVESRPIGEPALLRYALSERGVGEEQLRRYCSEVLFRIGDGVRRYFSLGFPCDAGGWVLRSAMRSPSLAKISASPCGVTSIDSSGSFAIEPSSDTVLVFEGFIDFLSYLTMRGVSVPGADVCVLNSTSNWRQACPVVRRHRRALLYLDNDPAGDRCTSDLSVGCLATECTDMRGTYPDFNDLNDRLCGRRLEAPYHSNQTI